jgi:transcriptional regulator with XRE-family HTH domain
MTLDDYRQSMKPKITKKEMCRRMGISFHTWSKWEHKIDAPRRFKLAAWAVARNADI